ncbi:hypothetical protein BB427_13900 [Pseudoalteromonas sp. BMB]|uniref:hypothetical protein n=1 Tax=Pseudoalteromonas sp. BMB TaxID=1874619 RepID=UPI00083D549D|nr:hypothetical protein [Pseudoalteromonas sp. BMB]ODB37086.1 hypothetical protein BB427_13900 [Pseudoalteromonas sp. BMB]
MNELQFKQTEVVGDYQLIILVAVSLILVGIYLYLKMYKKPTLNSSKGIKVIGQTRVGQHSVVYEMQSKDRTYVVYESKSGVVELFGQDTKSGELDSE